MKTIAKYLIKLQKELKKMHGDTASLEEYRSHLSESFIAFKKKKESSYFNDQELEDLFVEQLEPVNIIAQSLVGLEGGFSTTSSAIHAQTQLKSDVRQLLSDFKELLTSKVSKIKRFYLKHRSPITTAFVYLLYFILLWIGESLLIFILPEVNTISCFGGQSFIHIGSMDSVSCRTTQVNGYIQGGGFISTPILKNYSGLLLIFLMSILFIRFGYRNEKKYSILTGIYLGLLFIPILKSQIIFSLYTYTISAILLIILIGILIPILVGILLKQLITNFKLLLTNFRTISRKNSY